MVSASLSSLVSSGYDLFEAVSGRRALNVLCIGHGGGSLPLFLASKIKGTKFLLFFIYLRSFFYCLLTLTLFVLHVWFMTIVFYALEWSKTI